MRIKALKTIVYHSQVIAIGSETEMSEEAAKAFGEEYVEILESKPEKAEAPETKEPENQEEGTESAEPEKAERKKNKKK